MSDYLERVGNLSPKQLLLLVLDQHDQLAEIRARDKEPIAIVGLGCRLPGADDPEAFWSLLDSGRDAIREVPAERWDVDALFDPDPDAPGRMSVRSGGFLDVISGFDAGFFGISAREALTMDPQQRLLLEVAWESLENACIAPESLSGTAAGVFVGICNSDHYQRMLARGSEAIDGWTASGSAPSVAAGRISYCLGLRGPALSVDTACSSSLVALHLACRSLRAGESRVALACGVNLMCSPETTIALSKARMLAPDGRCKTFDAAADGFSRGEGCGVLVLKRLADAQADGDRVHALVRGTAVNQDGRSSGLTVPNGPAQDAVIRAALADAGVAARDIDYVEAHGTGTSLGDPIELRALASALGAGRAAERRLLVGSVKTNIGHLEAAAGIAGVIKVVLAMRHRRIPPHLHFHTPSPHIPWDELALQVTAQGRPWPEGNGPRLAGVSSFGFSGTNAHVVLADAPRLDRDAQPSAPKAHCLPLSARSEAALLRLSARQAHALAGDDPPSLAAVARTLGAGRSHLPRRLAVVAQDIEAAGAAFDAYARGAPHPAVHAGSAPTGEAPEIVFLFSGQGGQHPGMSRQLYEGAAVFREVIDRCDRLLGADARGRTLGGVLWPAGPDDTTIHETQWTQPALFAVEYALAELWRSFGVTPAAVLGHSLGEYVAACVAGVFTLEDGLRLVRARGQLMQELPGHGAMATLFAPEAAVREAMGPSGGALSIAAVNAPEQVVVSGEAEALDALVAAFAARGVEARRLRISVAAHSHLMDPALDGMEAAARQVRMRTPTIPAAWNVTGKVSATAPDAHYWRQHMREPVRFADGIRNLHAGGYRTFLEIGPHPTLLALAQQSLPESGTLLLSSLRRGRDDWQELGESLAKLYVGGATLDWNAVEQGVLPAPLPTYPFERRTYWITPGREKPARTAAPAATRGLAGQRLDTAFPVFETLLTPDSPGWLGEHRVGGRVLAAAPVFLALAQEGAAAAFGAGPRRIEEFVIQEPLVLEEIGRVVQLHIHAGLADGTPFSVHSRDAASADGWLLHATGRLVEGRAGLSCGDTPRAPCGAAIGPLRDMAAFYDRLGELGIAFGPAFRVLTKAHWRKGEVMARVEQPSSLPDEPWAHPAALDGALQAVGLAVPEEQDALYFLSEIGCVALARPLPRGFWCHAELRDAAAENPAERWGDVKLFDDDGVMLGTLDGVCLRRRSSNGGSLLYGVQWEKLSKAAARALPSPHSIVSTARESFAALAHRNELSIYARLLPALDRLSVAYVSAALTRLEFDATRGRRFQSDDEAVRLGVASGHRRLLARLFEILTEEGVLLRRGDAFEVAGALPASDPESESAALVAEFAPVEGELLMLQSCGNDLACALTGERDPVQLLFPDGSFELARKIYDDSPYARTYNATLRDALLAAIAALPAGATLRVLEIGAGTGGTTGYVLPALQAHDVEYTFTDLSPLFLERAGERFAACPSVKRALLDIEQDPAAQGFASGGYDVVIAANVLHATADLVATVGHVRQLLAPGGLMFLLEGVAPERWVDLTFGLTEGWWRFSDAALRPTYPLIGVPAWKALLHECGFTDVASIPQDRPQAREDQQALIIARASPAVRRWTLVGDSDAVGLALAQRLRARGDAVSIRDTESKVPPEDGELVYLGALPLAGRPGDAFDAVTDCETLAYRTPLRILARLERGRAWLVTRGVHPLAGATSPGARWQSPLWGLGRGYALERPERWGGLIDLPAEGSATMLADTLLSALDAADGEDQIACRDDERYAARLTPLPVPRTPAFTPRRDAAYLVTGGFGGLGALVGRWLAERGARHIVLLGRNPDPGSEAVRAIETLGARVLCCGADVADAESVAAAIALIGREMPPLRGIFHAAADLSSAPLAALSEAQLAAMAAAKITGTVNLERATSGLDLDAFVLFSSTTALLGASGLTHYAAANAFLDGTAAAGRPGTLAINWGTWDAMRTASEADRRAYRESGLKPMPARAALDALGKLMAGHASHVAVADIDWSVLKPLHEVKRKRPFLARLGSSSAAAAVSNRSPRAPTEAALMPERLAGLSEERQEELVLDFVRETVAATLDTPSDETVPTELGLFEMGMDSLMAMELKRRLEAGVGRALPATLTFNHPNVAALTRFLLDLLVAKAASRPADTTPSVRESLRETTAVVDLDELSDSEVERRLLARLERLG